MNVKEHPSNLFDLLNACLDQAAAFHLFLSQLKINAAPFSEQPETDIQSTHCLE